MVLPPRYISFPYLLIDKAIKIKGRPGTLVEINNGLIVVSSSSGVKCQVSECSFVFNIEVKSFQEKIKKDDLLKNYVKFYNQKFHTALFYVLPESSVEISDCDFRAIVHEEEQILEEGDQRRVVCETLFSVQKAEMIMQSTICSNFYRILEGHGASLLKFVHCHFSDILSQAFYLMNTSNFEFLQSTVKNSLSGLNIFYDEKINSNLKILDSEFSQNKNYAIRINYETNKEVKIFDSVSNNFNNLATSLNYLPSVLIQINKNIFKQKFS